MGNSTTIEDLPEPLLIHILSFLYIREAIQTSLLSRSFRNLYHSNPSLHFDIFDFYSRSTSPNPRSNESRQLFAEFVSQTLFLRPHYPLTKLALSFEYANYDQHKFYVQNWIRYANNLSVSELVLNFNEDRFYLFKDDEADEGDGFCRFDFDLLDIAKSCIKVLKLHACYLSLPKKSNRIKFVSLKSLEITVDSLGDDDVSNLLALCVNLETLKFQNMEFVGHGGLRIYSDSLKELDLDHCGTGVLAEPLDLNICCPNLGKISLIVYDVGKFIIKDATRLVEVWVEYLSFTRPESYYRRWETMLSYFTNISSLLVWDELLESDDIPAGCEQFTSNVKHLELYCDYYEDDLVGVAALLKLLPKLEILGLCNRDTKDANLHKDYRRASTVFNMPCLKKVILRNYQRTKCERHFIKLFKKSGIVLEKVELLHATEEEG